MKRIVTLTLIAFLLTSCVNWFRAPTIRTYSINGKITYLNECDNTPPPATITIRIKNYYRGYPSNVMNKSVTVAMVPQGNGTALGDFDVSDVPTSSKLKHWTIEYPPECTYNNCTVGNCTNLAQLIRQPINSNGLIAQYDREYSCGCN